MRSSKKVLASVLAAVMTADMVPGCGGGSKASAIAAPSTGSQAAGSEVAGNQAARDGGVESRVLGEIEAGSSLTIAIPQPHNTFFVPQSTITGDRSGAQSVLESLGRADTKGNYLPWSTEKFATDPDNSTLITKLRDSVKFHDGSVCDGGAATWGAQQYTDSGKASEIGTPREVKIVNDLIVQIQYDEWASNWGNIIGDIYICSKETYEKNGVKWYQTHTVGTGLFILGSSIADDEITYIKNKDYRTEGQLYIDHLRTGMVTDTGTITSAPLNKKVDAAMKLESNIIINVIKQAGFESAERESVNVTDIKHTTRNSRNDKHPMGGLKVCQVIMYAIQWDDVAKALSGGLGEPTSLSCTSNSRAYTLGAKFYEYDPDFARQILAGAGYPNGLETTTRTKVVGNDTATAFQAILVQIDIKAEVNVMNSFALAAIQREDDIDGSIASRGANKMDFTNNYVHLYPSEGVKNHGIMLCPAELEESLFAAKAAKIIEEKKVNLQKAVKALVRDYMMIAPVAVVYHGTFATPGPEDSGIHDVSLEQWASETVHWTK